MKLSKAFIALAISLVFVSCKDNENVNPIIDTFDPDYRAEINPADFTHIIDNPYLSFLEGATFTYTGQTEDGTERTEIEVLNETKVVMGVTCTIVRDIVYLNNVIIEDTRDWYAQDKEGNVWYFGEDVDNYENGVIVNNDGAWEAGVDGAKPGFVMLAYPAPGLLYRQEYYKGNAEDRAEIVSIDETVTIGIGTFTQCIKIRETTPLEADVLEFKYYAPGIGVIKVENATDLETEELTAYND